MNNKLKNNMAIIGKDMRGSGSKVNVGRKKTGKIGYVVRSLPENKQKIKDYANKIDKNERFFSKAEVIDIVEKSRETGINADFLLL